MRKNVLMAGLLASFLLIGSGCSNMNLMPIEEVQPALDTQANARKSSDSKTINVNNASELKDALANAVPGDRIVLANGVYKGKFKIPSGKNGTDSKRIILEGTRNAIIDAGSLKSGYALHVLSSYWTIKGITFKNAKKGIMVDNAKYVTIDDVKVTDIGDEGIHLRQFSSNCTVKNADVDRCGLVNAEYGEGVYVGSAHSNWKTYSNSKPDKCDNNQILNCQFGSEIAAENIDIKEGTTGTLVEGNSFNGAGLKSENYADSWMDVKGNNATIRNNTGKNIKGSVGNGFEVHVVYKGWGQNNVFSNNNINVGAKGYGFYIAVKSSKGRAIGTVVNSTNTVTNATKGTTNIPLDTAIK